MGGEEVVVAMSRIMKVLGGSRDKKESEKSKRTEILDS